MMNHQQDHFFSPISIHLGIHIAILRSFTKFNLKTYVCIKFLSHFNKQLFI